MQNQPARLLVLGFWHPQHHRRVSSAKPCGGLSGAHSPSACLFHEEHQHVTTLTSAFCMAHCVCRVGRGQAREGSWICIDPQKVSLLYFSPGQGSNSTPSDQLL